MRFGKRVALALLLVFSPILSPAGEVFASDPEPIVLKIGASIPLTGDLADYGAAIRNGFKLAESKFPERFKHLQIAFEDNRYSAQEAITVFRKLTLNHQMDLIYSWGEAPFSATAPLAEKERIPLLALSIDETPALGKRYSLRVGNSPEELLTPLLEVLRKGC